VEKQIGAIF